MQQEDPHLSKIFKLLEENDNKPKYKHKKSEDVEVKRFLKKWEQLKIKDGILYRVISDNGDSKNLLIIPEALRNMVLSHMHTLSGHQGKERTASLVRQRTYWPTINKDVDKYCRNCTRCVTAKEPRPKSKVEMAHLLASNPLEIISVDYTILEKSSSGYENVLVMTDVFSKLTIAIPTMDQTAKTTAKVLVKNWFHVFGIPSRIHSDRGGSFENKVITELCKTYGIKK